MTDVKRLGVIHLFCISGMHVVLLITILRWLGVYLWLDREVVDGILILALPFYLIIAGGSTESDSGSDHGGSGATPGYPEA